MAGAGRIPADFSIRADAEADTPEAVADIAHLVMLSDPQLGDRFEFLCQPQMA